MFNCYLCEKVSCYTTYFCEDCRKIKNIMNVYGAKDVLSIVETTCLRNQEQIGYKVSGIIKKKKVDFEKLPVIREEPPKNVPLETRSQKKKLKAST